MAGHYNKENTDCQCVSLATKKQPTMPLSRQGLSSWLGSLHSGQLDTYYLSFTKSANDRRALIGVLLELMP